MKYKKQKELVRERSNTIFSLTIDLHGGLKESLIYVG